MSNQQRYVELDVINNFANNSASEVVVAGEREPVVSGEPVQEQFL
jgi:hypothetical protein